MTRSKPGSPMPAETSVELDSAKHLLPGKSLCVAGMLIVILLGTLFLRIHSLYLPHGKVDEIQYLALAMKLDASGFSGYNLREIDVSVRGPHFFLAPARSGTRGNLLTRMPQYYDAPLFHKPPLFPYSLMVSHRLFAPGEPYAAVIARPGSDVSWKERWAQGAKQFYGAVVPIVFSVLLVATTFALGKALFSTQVGAFAAILMSISPIDVLSSQKIVTDDMLSFFVAAAFLLYYMSRREKSIGLALAAGISFGLATLAKSSGNIVLPAILIYEAWKYAQSRYVSTCGAARAFDRFFLIFALVGVLLAIPWHLHIAQTYGTLYHYPAASQTNLLQTDPWFSFVFNRPFYMYLINIPAQTPLLFLVYPAIFGIFMRRIPKTEQEKDCMILLSIWIVVFLLSLVWSNIGRELRYMLPAYPAIAALSANVMERLRGWINSKFGYHLGTLCILAALALCGWWSIHLGLTHVLENAAEIRFPF